MGGYSHSVWYVPYDYKEIQSKYHITHIPHVTIETNLVTLENAYDVYDKHVKTYPVVKISFLNELVKFPSFYVHDPLQAYGWYVEKINPSLNIDDWRPHMSLKYQSHKDASPNLFNDVPAPTDLTCFLAIADTFSDNPCEWRIICDSSNTECE